MATAIDWSYIGEKGQDKWGELSKEITICKNGIKQSPVNINSADVKLHKTDQTMSINYKTSAVTIKNTGHTIEVRVSGNDNFIRLNGTVYYLSQFHFHAPSEHQINNRSYPMEIHFVNKSNGGKLAILALFVKIGKHSGLLDPIFQNLPSERMEQIKLKSNVHFNDLFTKKSSFYYYIGSLTTPPCTEDVKWIIFKQPIEISTGQLAAFSNLYYLNNRSPQPLNKRKVSIGTLN
jgi:carbonic anhydrase